MKTTMAPARANRMVSNRQRAYLEAMDIGVWSLRKSSASLQSPSVLPAQDLSTAAAHPPVTQATEKAQGLKLGPGGGGVLLVCAADTDSVSRLANDIIRALGSAPVWAWPQDESSAVTLTSAVDENLFTMVAIFGIELAEQFFDGELPHSLNSASLVLLPAMQDLQSRAEKRRALWATICRSGMVRAS
jgi:DNA polymerase III psi subunit